MEDRKYWLTESQLNSIYHYRAMFEYQADTIQNLCSTERDDVVYGFELGKLHSHQRDCFVAMMELYDEVKKQKCSE